MQFTQRFRPHGRPTNRGRNSSRSCSCSTTKSTGSTVKRVNYVPWLLVSLRNNKHSKTAWTVARLLHTPLPTSSCYFSLCIDLNRTFRPRLCATATLQWSDEKRLATIVEIRVMSYGNADHTMFRGPTHWRYMKYIKFKGAFWGYLICFREKSIYFFRKEILIRTVFRKHC